jgi:hypothetical protein
MWMGLDVTVARTDFHGALALGTIQGIGMDGGAKCRVSACKGYGERV